MLDKKVWDDPIERSSMPDGGIIVKAKLLAGCKNWEIPMKRKFKGRIVAMGNVYWDKWMRIVRRRRQILAKGAARDVVECVATAGEALK